VNKRGEVNYSLGKSITRRRGAAIITICILSLPYHHDAIRVRTGVATSTASDINLQAVKTVTLLVAPWQKETPLPLLGLLSRCESRLGISEEEVVGGILGHMVGGVSEPGVPRVGDTEQVFPGLVGRRNVEPESPKHRGEIRLRSTGLLGRSSIEPKAPVVGEDMGARIPRFLKQRES